jgi:hypothetical protein
VLLHDSYTPKELLGDRLRVGKSSHFHGQDKLRHPSYLTPVQVDDDLLTALSNQMINLLFRG